MRSLSIVTLGMLVVSSSPLRGHAQTPQGPPRGSATIGGNVDSVFSRLLAQVGAEGCQIGTVDHGIRSISATCPGADEAVILRVQAKGDSTRLSAQGSRGGLRAMVVGLNIIQRLVDAPPEGALPRMPEGTDWTRNEAGRVGFLVLSEEGRRFVRMMGSDTAFEVRPSELPSALREEWEDDINHAGFDPSCARVFRAGGLFFLRWNRCVAPDPELDRFVIYGNDGRSPGSASGTFVARLVSVMCPTVRSETVPEPDQRCPPPW